jgi:hypothetical protein
MPLPDDRYVLHFVTAGLAPFPVKWCTKDGVHRLVASQNTDDDPDLVPLRQDKNKLIIYNTFAPPGNLTARKSVTDDIVTSPLLPREFFTFGDSNVFNAIKIIDSQFNVSLDTDEQLVIDKIDVCDGHYPLLFVDSTTLQNNPQRFSAGQLQIKPSVTIQSTGFPWWGVLLIIFAIIWIGLIVYFAFFRNKHWFAKNRNKSVQEPTSDIALTALSSTSATD